jgi:hypothetical protein
MGSPNEQSHSARPDLSRPQIPARNHRVMRAVVSHLSPELSRSCRDDGRARRRHFPLDHSSLGTALCPGIREAVVSVCPRLAGVNYFFRWRLSYLPVLSLWKVSTANPLQILGKSVFNEIDPQPSAYRIHIFDEPHEFVVELGSPLRDLLGISRPPDARSAPPCARRRGVSRDSPGAHCDSRQP